MAADPQNWILGYSDWGDRALVTASSQQADTPVTNLQTIQPTDLWTATSLSPIVVLDRGEQQPWNLILPLFTNAAADAVWRVRAANDLGLITSSPIYDTGQAVKLGPSFLSDARQTEAGFATGSWTWEFRFRRRGLGTGYVAARSSSSPSGEVSALLGIDGLLIVFLNGTALNAVTTFPGLHEWHTISVTYDSGNVRLYVDGVLDAQTTKDLSALSLQTLAVSGNVFCAEVDVDWMRLFTYVRTPEEVAAYAGRQIGFASAGMVANYTFNGSLANSGSVGGSMATTVGSASYRPTMRLWASPGLDAYEKRHGILWVPDDEPAQSAVGDPETVTCQYLQLDFDWTGHPDALLSMGRLIVSNAHQFLRNPVYGADVYGFEDSSLYDDMQGGQRLITPSQPVPRFRLPFSFDSESELLEFMEIVRLRGAGRDVALVLNPVDHDGRRHHRIGYGHLQQRVAANLPAYQHFRSEVELRGLI